IRGPAIGLLRHERPLEAGRETRAAAAAQVRLLDLVDDRVAAFGKDVLGVVPDAAAPGAGELPVVLAVEIEEDAVFVLERHVTPPLPLQRLSAWSCRRPAPSSGDRPAGRPWADGLRRARRAPSTGSRASGPRRNRR